MYSDTLKRLEQYNRSDQLKHLHAYLTVLTLLLIPLSTSLSTIAYFLLSLSAVYQITVQNRWASLLKHPFTRIFWPGALLVLIGCLYSSSSLTLSLIVAKKYFWFLVTPILLISLDSNLTQKASERLYTIYLSVISITLIIALYRVFLLTDYLAAVDDKIFMNNVFKDHIIQSLLFSIGFAISLYRLLSPQSTNKKIAYGILCILITFNVLFINAARTGYILIPLITVYTMMFRYRKAFIPSLLSLLILIPLFCFSPIINKRWETLTQTYSSYQESKHTRNPLSSRLTNWKIAFALFKQKPLAGYGTGGIGPARKSYINTHGLHFLRMDKLFDSSYLNFTVQYGILGIIFCLYFLSSLWSLSSRLNNFDKYLARIILLALLLILWINPWLSSSTPSHLISVLFALLYSSKKQT